MVTRNEHDGKDDLMSVAPKVLGGRIVDDRMLLLIWLQSPSDAIEECGCGWAPELACHYRAVIQA